ncbi:hypothetical protein [Candidatus Poriferisocius sp.]|uniref:hypothetical protein n=1 Tax=Candidatus Poriferisocius sp. TaxID=3101276 RepID=UPI003B596847
MEGVNLRGAGFSGFVSGLVVGVGVEGEVSEEFSGLGVDDADVEAGYLNDQSPDQFETAYTAAKTGQTKTENQNIQPAEVPPFSWRHAL